MAAQNLLLQGATGSIGLSTLDVVERNPQSVKLWGVTAKSSVQVLFDQIIKFEPKFAAMADVEAGNSLRQLIQDCGIKTQVLSGPESLVQLSAHEEVDAVMAAIVGAAGLESTVAAAKTGKKLLLANKESLVCSGKLLINAAKKGGSTILPIDSEHNAIFQCLAGLDTQKDISSKIRRIILTGSGGPFLNLSKEVLSRVTREQACAHPNWSMGAKISVDSASMMNKGLELIEACWLFNVSSDIVDIVIHPESVIHSMVEYRDGSILSQMGCPDMRTPIAHALCWPNRLDSGVSSLDLMNASFTFQEPDLDKFPSLNLARNCAEKMGAYPIVLNAANEIAVEAFLAGKISFLQIYELIERICDSCDWTEPNSIDEVIEIDSMTRKTSQLSIREMRI